MPTTRVRRIRDIASASSRALVSRSLITLGVALLAPANAHAMHLAEGILPLGWAALWGAVALPFVAIALALYRRRSAHDPFYRPFVAMVAAAVFLISCNADPRAHRGHVLPPLRDRARRDPDRAVDDGARHRRRRHSATELSRARARNSAAP
jgi:hypothetical protein